MHTYDQSKNDNKTLTQVEEDQKKKRITSELGQITSGRPKD